MILRLKKYGYKLLDIFNRSSYYHEFKYPKTSEVEKYGTVVILTDENETETLKTKTRVSVLLIILTPLSL